MGEMGPGETDDGLFRSFLEAAPDGALIVDADGRIALVNGQTERMFGYPREALLGRHVEMLLPKAMRSVHERHRAGFTAHSEVRPMGAGMDLVGLRQDGSTFPVEISLAPLQTNSGLFISASVRDVTERQRVVQALRESQARLTELVENSAEMILIISDEGRVVYSNPAAVQALGEDIFDPDRGLFDRLHPDDVPAAAQALAATMSAPRAGARLTVRYLHQDGTWHECEGVGTNLIDDPAVRGIVVNVRDVTQRLKDARLISSQRGVLLKIATGLPLLECLQALVDLVREQLPDALVDFALPESPGSESTHFVLGASTAAGGSVQEACAIVVERAVESGRSARRSYVDRETARRCTAFATPLFARDGKPLLGVLAACVADEMLARGVETGVLDVARSMAQITLERQSDTDRLINLALHDDLTGLPNRTLFLDRLDQTLDTERRQGMFTAVLFCDLDRFKGINDSLGHSVGDQVLQGVARRIHELLRPGDTVARFGGDEFVILAANLHEEEEALVVAERLVREVRLPLEIPALDGGVTVSVGLAVTSAPEIDAAMLLAQADTALYRAKAMGGDRAEVFDEDLRELARVRLDTEAGLRTALAEDQLSLRFQPEIDLISGRVTCAEVLLRWDRPGAGAVTPSSFVALAEETGLILPLGAWVLEHACQQGAAWNNAGNPVTLAVNVSARELSHSDLAGAVEQALESTGMPASLLRLEVTEAAIMKDGDELTDTLARLTRLGVGISIDDFGTGYSSLLFLKRLPVRELKIDGGFVHGLGVDVDDEGVVSGIVQLARALGLTTVAEGVETQEQLDWVRRLGCTTAQGYLLGRPMHAGEFAEWYAAGGLLPRPRGEPVPQDRVR
jgi:diguanylate cyclase (GGDEF)-like protein/PAS domain S-box-containing protein